MPWNALSWGEHNYLFDVSLGSWPSQNDLTKSRHGYKPLCQRAVSQCNRAIIPASCYILKYIFTDPEGCPCSQQIWFWWLHGRWQSSCVLQWSHAFLTSSINIVLFSIIILLIRWEPLARVHRSPHSLTSISVNIFIVKCGKNDSIGQKLTCVFCPIIYILLLIFCNTSVMAEVNFAIFVLLVSGKM